MAKSDLHSDGDAFRLPIGAAGLTHPQVLICGLKLGVLAALSMMFAMLMESSVLGGPTTGKILSDVAFFLPRMPSGVRSSLSGAAPVNWKWVLFGVAVFVLTGAPALTAAAGLMARELSKGDRFPLSSRQAARVNWAIASLFLISVVGGITLWLSLLSPADSFTLRILRAAAIAFLLQLVCMFLGGAMACSQAEGRSGWDALSRMAMLTWSQRGNFTRAAVYTMPRWLIGSCVSSIAALAALLLPFYLADTLLPPWLAFAQHPGSRLLQVARWVALPVLGIFAGLVSLALVSKGRQLRQPLTRFTGFLILAAAVWFLLVLPVAKPAAVRTADGGLWFSSAAAFVTGEPTGPQSWQVLAGLMLSGAIIFLNTAVLVALWLLLHPLAAGVCAFFSMRKAAEGKLYREPDAASDTRRASGASHAILAAAGASLFTGGGRSSLAALSPPQGWLPLSWLSLYPPTVALSLMAVVTVAAIVRYGGRFPEPWVRWAGVGAIVAVAFLPWLCRCAGRSLTKTRDKNEGFTRLLAVAVGAWGLALGNAALALAGVVLGGSLGLVPWIGPVLWGVAYFLLLLGANVVVVSVIRWSTGALILPPLVACDPAASAAASAAYSRTDYCARATAPGFLAGLAVGLPLALVPTAVLAGALWLTWAIQEPPVLARFGRAMACVLANGPQPPNAAGWLDVAAILTVLTLALSGFTTALTNAYLAIKHVMAHRPLQVGDVVILGRHGEVNGEDNWNPAMERFVGHRAKIVCFHGRDESGCGLIGVDIDHGSYAWRVENTTAPGDAP